MTKKFNKNLMVPFDKNGNMKGYHHNAAELRPNHRIITRLRYVGVSRGCSSVKFNFESCRGGERYEMFAIDFDEMVVGNEINFNDIRGEFYFVKRGKNFGIKMAQDND